MIGAHVAQLMRAARGRKGASAGLLPTASVPWLRSTLLPAFGRDFTAALGC